MEKNCPKYFLAANSSFGFVSYFEKCYDPKYGWKAYIIKGGPGTGKSSFMKFLLNVALEKGQPAVVCPCSSDPNSFDAVLFPKIKIAVLDGTSPHTVDPKYPAVGDTLLNFGEFWDEDMLLKNKAEIIKVTEENKFYHKLASLYIKSSGKVTESNYEIAYKNTDLGRVFEFGKKLCKKYFEKIGTKGREEVRFISGVTPNGIVNLNDTITHNFNEIVIIRDNFGVVSNALMEFVSGYAVNNGYEIIRLKNHILPEMTDHILIPKISLAFVRETDSNIFENKTRRIRINRFTDMKNLCVQKKKIKMNNKLINELLNSAIENLKTAKETHDKLEKFYIEAMDFSKLKNFAEEFAEKIFS